MNKIDLGQAHGAQEAVTSKRARRLPERYKDTDATEVNCY